MLQAITLSLKKKRSLPIRISVKKENTSNVKALFLDLDISLKHKQFGTEQFGKRNAFHFCIARMPYRDSNMSTRTFYAAVGSEILCLSRTVSSK